MCLKISIEAMKFFYRHKTYCELFYIDIKRRDESFLKSMIRKFSQTKLEFDENNENEEDEYEEFIKQKSCFILINKCNNNDLLRIDIYSILNNNFSFIIIYDEDNYDFKLQIKIKIIEGEEKEEKVKKEKKEKKEKYDEELKEEKKEEKGEKEEQKGDKKEISLINKDILEKKI